MKRVRTVGKGYPVTPDGRYFVVRGRLWRMTDPGLAQEEREELQKALMKARGALGKARKAGDVVRGAKARAAIDLVKRKLGERGKVWWTDGARDWNQYLVKNTPYREWFEKSQTKG